MSNGDLIAKAEREIGEILKKLEVDTSLIVDSVAMKTIDVSTVSSKEFVKTVVIEMSQPASAHW